MSVHTLCKAMVIGLGLLLGQGQGLAQPAFTIVAIPDTQYYAQSTLGPGANTFDVQMDWMVRNTSAWNIVFATHLGDVVDVAGGVGAPNLGEWDDAVRAMGILRGSGLPHGVLPGNHDWTNSSGDGSIEHYRARFGDTSGYFAGAPWFLGFDARGLSSAQVFQTPIGPMLHLSLEWNASMPAVSSDRPALAGDALGWAQAMLDAHPGMPTIVSTHNNVNAASIRDGAGNGLFERFVRRNDQVFMVLNGHYHGEGRIDTVNDFGRVVYELNSDYQSRNRGSVGGGGDGWLRLYEFRPAESKIRVRTYTPLASAVDGSIAGPEFGGIGKVEEDADSSFDLPLDFVWRLSPPPAVPREGAAPRSGQAYTLRRGLNGYAGVENTEVRASNPSAYLGLQGYMHIDTDDTAGGGAAGLSCGLVKFGGLFGTGANELAADRDVLSATLRLYVHESRSNSEGSGMELRRMLVPWTSLSTWNSLTMAGTHAGSPPGVAPFGSSGYEAMGGADGYAGGNVSAVGVRAGRWLEFDVTRGVRAWKNGQANHGWLVQPFANNTNGLRIETSETELAGARMPELSIVPTLGRVRTVEFTVGTDTRLDESQPFTNLGSVGTLVTDAAVEDNLDPAGSDVQSLIRFADVFGSGEGKVPPNALVSSAVLVLNVNPDVTFHQGTGFRVHRMLRGWTEATTWSSSGLGGDGVSLDNIDAAAIADDGVGVGEVAGELNANAVQAGRYVLDVTRSVRAWADGNGNADNHGWALVPRPFGTNGIFVDGFDATHTGAVRPRLIVRFVCRADFDGTGQLEVSDVFAFIGAWFAGAGAADFDGSGVLDISDVFVFLNVWFDGCG